MSAPTQTAGDRFPAFGEASVRRAWIALGANLGDPPRQLRDALQRIAQLPQVRLVAKSSLYRTEPIGLPGQADYCNAACEVETALSARALLQALMQLELAAGRVRDGRRWAPRVLDLDLLHVEGCSHTEPALMLPHPEIGRRNFVLLPLAQIAPQLEIPGLGRVDLLARALGDAGVRIWHD